MIHDSSSCSQAQAGVELAVVGREGPKKAAGQNEIDLDRGASVVGRAGDGDSSCMCRGKQSGGSDESGKHGEQGRMWIFGIFWNGTRSGKVDAGSEEGSTKHGGLL